MDFFIHTILTPKCNKNCHYCDRKIVVGDTDTITIDIDNLLSKFSYFKDDNLYVELSGGEPGLVSNLEEVIAALQEQKYVDKIYLLSNGLIRKTMPEVIPMVDYYYEHLILDINDKKIDKFYDDLDFDYKDNRYCIVVTTTNTLKSIMNNFDYYNDIGLFGDNIIYKMLINKTETSIVNSELFGDFYKLITGNSTNINRSLGLVDRFFFSEKELNIKRSYCGIMAYNLFLDIEKDVLGHCSLYYSRSKCVSINEENINKLKSHKLFKKEKYCDVCYWYKEYELLDIIKNNRRFNKYIL